MNRPTMFDDESESRARRQEVRAMLLTEAFGDEKDQVLRDWMLALMGEERAAALGPPDTSANTLLSIACQLSTPGLYGLGAPFVRNSDMGFGMSVVRALQDGGVWERMQFVELMARGIGDWVLRVEVDTDGADPVIRVRNAEPWNVWTRCDPSRYDRIVELRERRLRTDPVSGQPVWCWDVYDLTPGRERYAVVSADGTDLSNLYLTLPDGTDAPAEGLVGDAYPFRWRDGRPFLPFVFYSSMDTGGVWHEMGRRGATRGALNSITYHTYVGQVARSATGSAVIAVGLQPPTGTVGGVGRPDATPGISLQPGEILFLQPREGVITASITQVGPGANLDVLSRYALTYESQQAHREGLSSDDVSKDAANPESAAALAIKNSGKRAAAARITPHFRRRDLDLVAKAAALLRLAGVATPETGWSIEYRQIPLSPDEQQQQLDYDIAQRDQGLISTVDLYMRQHPGVSRDTAISELKRIRAEEAMLTAEAPATPAPPAAPAPPAEDPEEADPAEAEMETEDVADEDVLMREALDEAAAALSKGDTQAAQLAIARAQGMMMADEGEDAGEEGDAPAEVGDAG